MDRGYSELLRRYPNLNWDITMQRTESLNAERMLHVGLALAAGLLDAPVPNEIWQRGASRSAGTDLCFGNNKPSHEP